MSYEPICELAYQASQSQTGPQLWQYQEIRLGIRHGRLFDLSKDIDILTLILSSLVFRKYNEM